MQDGSIPGFQRSLLQWFEGERRDLPWRRTRDPYRIWVSEIMLQQTRVAAVLDHYAQFFQSFPTLEALACASESSVLTAWSGLGYYRRARMMHAAAREIVQKRDGVFPADSQSLLTLPGIGRYTAAAIASIAFGEPVAVVDGNVERVVQRVLGKKIKPAELWGCAEMLLSRDHPGDFNQAMMELGATICLPRDPKCLTCPVVNLCQTKGELNFSKTPAKQKKKELWYALHCTEGAVFLVQRPRHASLMPAMWELPGLALKGKVSHRAWLTLRHSITVTDYRVHVLRTPKHDPEGRWIPKERLASIPLTGLARKILIAAELLRPRTREPL